MEPCTFVHSHQILPPSILFYHKDTLVRYFLRTDICFLDWRSFHEWQLRREWEGAVSALKKDVSKSCETGSRSKWFLCRLGVPEAFLPLKSYRAHHYGFSSTKTSLLVVHSIVYFFFELSCIFIMIWFFMWAYLERMICGEVRCPFFLFSFFSSHLFGGDLVHSVDKVIDGCDGREILSPYQLPTYRPISN